ncbi:MAG TPA: hypothetical protein VFT42_08755 [Solirubrobacteraceae bacterium]|nr:hypothetical protein [Solirubrobacteraceae bacterium]
MESRDELEDEERRQGRFERAEPSSGEMVAKRLQDEMRSAVESIRSGAWAPVAPED